MRNLRAFRLPTPAAGAIYIIANDRVHPVDMPFTKAVSVISKWGAGSRELLAGMKRVAAGSAIHEPRASPSRRLAVLTAQKS